MPFLCDRIIISSCRRLLKGNNGIGYNGRLGYQLHRKLAGRFIHNLLIQVERSDLKSSLLVEINRVAKGADYVECYLVSAECGCIAVLVLEHYCLISSDICAGDTCES